MNVFLDNAKMRQLSPARWIRRVTSVGSLRVALVFENSPCAYGNVTENLLKVLREKNGKATFGVYGSTAENPKSRRYAHLPVAGQEHCGGAEACGDLLKAIVTDGHEIVGLGYRAIPASRMIWERRKCFPRAKDAYEDGLRLLELLSSQNIHPRFFRPLGNGQETRDERSVIDIYNALDVNLVAPQHSLLGYFTERGAEGQRLLADLRKKLQKSPGTLDGCILDLPGGAFAEQLPEVLGALLDLFAEYGYETVTVSALTDASPFTDIGPSYDVFVPAKKLLRAGHTVVGRDNRLHPHAPVTRKELYAMMVPREIMVDYMRSRLTGCAPAYDICRRKEKELWVAPGTPEAIGTFYGYEQGWPLGDNLPITPAGFSAFLEKAAQGRDVDFTHTDAKYLEKATVLDAIAQLIE